MQRISITEDDLRSASSRRSPAVYAPVPGVRNPQVYTPATEVAETSPATERSSGLPRWATVALIGLLIVLVAVGAFLLGRAGRVTDAEVQQQLTTQRLELTRDAGLAEQQAVRAARTEAARAADARVRAAESRGRAAGDKTGFDRGYDEGLAAGRAENGTCNSLIC